MAVYEPGALVPLTNAALIPSPDTGYGYLFVDGSGIVSVKKPDGTVVQPLSNPMTAAGDIVIGGTGGAASRLGVGSAGQVLKVVSGAPAWSADVGFANPMTTAGDLISGGASGAAQRLGAGSNGQILTMVSGAPAWAPAPTSGFSNPMTTSGDIIYGGASGAATRLGVGSTGQVLKVVGGVPTWAADVGFANPMTAAQDLIVGGASGAATRLGVGSNNQVLTVVSGSVAWATSSGLTNPMTTTGDIIVGGSSGTPARLGAGSNGQFLALSGGTPAWVSGGMQQIAQVVCAGSQSVVTFSSIPQNFTNLKLLVSARATGAASTIAVNILINSDTTGSDFSAGQYVVAQGSTGQPTAGLQTGSSTGVQAFTIAGTSGNANPLTGVELTVVGYSNTVMGKSVLINQIVNYTTGPASAQLLVEMLQWSPTAAITRMDFTAASGSFLNGSVFTLYGF